MVGCRSRCMCMILEQRHMGRVALMGPVSAEVAEGGAAAGAPPDVVELWELLASLNSLGWNFEIFLLTVVTEHLGYQFRFKPALSTSMGIYSLKKPSAIIK